MVASSEYLRVSEDEYRLLRIPETSVLTFRCVDRDRAIAQLPSMYAAALRLQENGYGNGVIAVALGTDPEQVPPVLLIAETKLASLLAEDDGSPIDLTRSGGEQAVRSARRPSQ